MPPPALGNYGASSPAAARAFRTRSARSASARSRCFVIAPMNRAEFSRGVKKGRCVDCRAKWQRGYCFCKILVSRAIVCRSPAEGKSCCRARCRLRRRTCSAFQALWRLKMCDDGARRWVETWCSAIWEGSYLAGPGLSVLTLAWGPPNLTTLCDFWGS
mgnify:CR=1 FL=1